MSSASTSSSSLLASGDLVPASATTATTTTTMELLLGQEEQQQDEQDRPFGRRRRRNRHPRGAAQWRIFQAITNKEPLVALQEILSVDPTAIRRKWGCGLQRGYPPLHFAVLHGASVDVVQFLLDSYPEALEIKGAVGCVPLHFAAQHSSDVSVISLLVDRCPTALDVRDYYGRTPLQIAARYGTPEVVQLLVDRCPMALRVTEYKFGRTTLLHIAARYGTLEVVQLLADRCPTALDVTDCNGRTPMHIAARYRRLEVVQLLADRCPTKALLVPDRNGLLPLHTAISRYHNRWDTSAWVAEQIVQCLVERGPEAARERYSDGRLPLEVAIMYDGCYNHRRLIEPVADAYPEALTVKDKKGFLPLHIALIWLAEANKRKLNNVDRFERVAIDLLMRHPEAAREKYPDDDSLPLHKATDCNARELVLRLADAYSEALMARDGNGFIPLHIALIQLAIEVQRGPPDNVIRRYEGLAVDLLLRRQEAAREKFRDDDSLPLHRATECSASVLVQCLADAHPPALMVKNRNGSLPIHIVINQFVKANSGEGSTRVLECIAARCPEAVLEKFRNGALPMHVLAACGTAETLQWVRIVADACPQALTLTDVDACLPVHVAAKHRNWDVLRFAMERWPGSLLEGDRDGRRPVHVAALHEAPLDVIYDMVRASPLSLE